MELFFVSSNHRPTLKPTHIYINHRSLKKPSHHQTIYIYSLKKVSKITTPRLKLIPIECVANEYPIWSVDCKQLAVNQIY